MKEVKYIVDCYEGVGLRYNGSLDVAVNGTKDLPWNLNPYLNVEVYPDLLNNFCRNPQVYGERPFCYIDHNKRMWEYCDIRKYPKDGGVHKLSFHYVRQSVHRERYFATENTNKYFV